MKKEELFEVLGNLEPGMVEKARSDRHPRRGVWKKWTAAAACAVIIGGAVLGVATWRNGREGSAVRYPSGVTRFWRLIRHLWSGQWMHRNSWKAMHTGTGGIRTGS
mgnify:CR=1 FL=1